MPGVYILWKENQVEALSPSLQPQPGRGWGRSPGKPSGEGQAPFYPSTRNRVAPKCPLVLSDLDSAKDEHSRR